MLTREMFFGRHLPMQDDDILKAAAKLNVSPAVIQTVIAVEAGGSPFDRSGRPKILFEAHLFGRHTNHRFEWVTDPHGKAISARRWDRTLYNGAGDWQYTRLFTAMHRDPEAAVKSTSFGAFQILGQEYTTAKFATLEDFVRAMADSAGKQLDAFVGYCQTRKLDDELRTLDWTSFARQYNGPGYAANQYDAKMATQYRRLAAQWAAKIQAAKANTPANDEQPEFEVSRHIVAAVQAALNALPQPPNPPLVVDGYIGPKTTSAVESFEKLAGLPGDGGIIDPVLLETLGVDV